MTFQQGMRRTMPGHRGKLHTYRSGTGSCCHVIIVVSCHGSDRGCGGGQGCEGGSGGSVLASSSSIMVVEIA